ncbi:unnamed protein product [Adineta ricciae]|uniref:G-protein coupled receptors family 1 profile domain-containing protein n=1 Tax=Adineta ricciae TaxID=249248 RepID=A0A814NV57_ADIRI|nr:unnamed protein product [Adineta ricciae]CAF1448335.1 unnamed protein product [Adineta ricciae]
MDSSLLTTVAILNNIRLCIFYIYFFAIVFGIIGHIINILVLTQLKLFRDNRWAFYLIIESVVDILYNLVMFTSNLLQIIYTIDPQSTVLVWCRSRLILFQTCTLISSFTVCYAACDQFFSTSYRLNLRRMFTFKLARYVLLISSCIWLLHSIMFGLFFNINSSLGCVITNPVFLHYSTWFFYPVLYGPLQIAIAALSSLSAFQNVRRIVRQQVPIIRRRLDQQMTAMILVRALFYIICSLPYSIYRMIIINKPNPQTDVLQYATRQLLFAIFTCWTGLNFTISFYIFFVTSARYRSQVKYLLVKKYWRRVKHLCSSNRNQVVPNNAPSSNSSMELE